MNRLRPHSRILTAAALVTAAFLSGCAAPTYTVDDGSPVDENLLSAIRLYGKGEQLIRPHIIKTAQLKDQDCDKQWELPFVVATSHELPREEKVAWARGLLVDERLSVIAASKESGLQAGDKIEKINGDDDDPGDMLEELIELRDDGDPFKITLSTGRAIRVEPTEVCRGRVEITKPAAPDAQDYHWLKTAHTMSLFNQELTPDEAMWIVLWTQGLSEEAGARMKTYHYGSKLIKTGLTIASIASGVGAAANAASNAAANIAASEAGKAAAQAAGKEAAKFAAEKVADSLRDKMVQTILKEAGKAAGQEIALAAVSSAGIFKSSLSGISWVAGTGFWMADKWALERMAKLGADPLAAYSLHYKLASRAQVDNAFVFDAERLANITRYADEGGFADKARLALSGTSHEALIATAEAVANESVEVRPLSAADPVQAVAEATRPEHQVMAAMTSPESLSAHKQDESSAKEQDNMSESSIKAKTD
ncbi:hypothetical protein Q8A64_04515 [Oxalobacteraceae bacterium R-40]|uniref:PDZ domain-containing protein n=1 Tax=Keguizhuia sedimenti TaxID=3064264 RepID=A0ABU1BL05_9BURK|nr:hypothetical protein [Oxalobacteraceae bacterium R-40]